MLQFKKLNDIDLKLLLLSGSGIKVDSLELIPYTLGEIRDYGYTNYMLGLQWISASIDDFIDSIKEDSKKQILLSEREHLKTLDFFTKLGGKELEDTLLMAMSMIFRTKDVRILDESVVAIDFLKDGIFYVNEEGFIDVNQEKLQSTSEENLKVVHRDNFDDVIEVIKLQNYLVKPTERKDSANPVDEETRALMEHMKKMREKVEAKKRKQREEEEGEIDISDIISAVCSKSNSINKINVWDLTLYQLYDEYARLELIDNYDFSVRAIMAGAEKVDLKHWSSKL